ncbi:MAG: sugar phosphate isomerase/epimerase [Bacillota bacterium]|nr:sugar phosphate isomerase/epimerase [Bacillota bacterium]
MNIGMITCNYFMRIYGYQRPENFNWGDMVKKYEAEFSQQDFLDLAREIRSIGFSSLEIWAPTFSYTVYTLEKAKEMAVALASLGFEKLAYCIGGWGDTDIGQIEKAYPFANAMGCHVVTGCIRKPDVDTVLPEIERCGKKYGMLYAIENHPLPSIEDFKDVKRLSEPYSTIGANLDTGIYNMLGYDVLEAADLLKDKIYHVHFKETPKGAAGGCLPLGDADTPLAPLLLKLRDWNYAHMVSVEFEYHGDPLPGLHKSLGFINGVLSR